MVTVADAKCVFGWNIEWIGGTVGVFLKESCYDHFYILQRYSSEWNPKFYRNGTRS